MANAMYAARARAAKAEKRQAQLRKAARARAGNTAKAQRAERCSICWGRMSRLTRTTMGCHHPLHRRCLYNWVRVNLFCPMCGYNYTRGRPRDRHGRTRRGLHDMTPEQALMEEEERPGNEKSSQSHDKRRKDGKNGRTTDHKQ
ncbi:hypothetical protein niasHT_009537 [Heterodera trifolii]|uniref:RING-type domain-containing protein n=1 Tax=Heterodera trifolii TaxID=157864 RepID=A0ABD2LQC3_9BILA